MAKEYKAVLVERVYTPKEGGVHGIYTSKEFGKAFGFGHNYLNEACLKETIIEGKYKVERLYRELGVYIYQVDEVDIEYKTMKGYKEARGTLKDIANQLHIGYTHMLKNFNKGHLVANEYKIIEIE